MINLIVAMTENRVIGKNNSIPWRIPEDMKLFKQYTLGNTVIMGRKTWDSLPPSFSPLPERHNIIITRNTSNVKYCATKSEVISVVHSIEGAIELFKEKLVPNYNKECFIIGGRQIYKEALEKDLVDTLYVSWIKEDHEGDTHFPDYNSHLFRQVEEIEYPDFIFKKYVK